MSFPASPTNGQQYTTSLGTRYEYRAADGAWVIVSQSLGVTGAQGMTGLAGTNGTNGATGLQGATGIFGSTGLRGATGVGTNGTSGTTGAQGATGLSGTGGGGGGGLWTSVAGSTGTAYYSSATQILIQDASNALVWQNKINKGTVLSWGHTGGTFQSMATTSGYTALIGTTGAVWVNTIGDTIITGLTGVQYTSDKARVVNFAIPGTLSTGTDLAGKFYVPFDTKVFGADVHVATAGTTGTTVFDINGATGGGTTMFSAKPTIAIAGTDSVNNTADSGPASIILDGSKMTVDVDTTWNPVDGYVTVYIWPNKNALLRL